VCKHNFWPAASVAAPPQAVKKWRTNACSRNGCPGLRRDCAGAASARRHVRIHGSRGCDSGIAQRRRGRGRGGATASAGCSTAKGAGRQRDNRVDGVHLVHVRRRTGSRSGAVRRRWVGRADADRAGWRRGRGQYCRRRRRRGVVADLKSSGSTYQAYIGCSVPCSLTDGMLAAAAQPAG